MIDENPNSPPNTRQAAEGLSSTTATPTIGNVLLSARYAVAL
jgi:hypothetical protein